MNNNLLKTHSKWPPFWLADFLIELTGKIYIKTVLRERENIYNIKMLSERV